MHFTRPKELAIGGLAGLAVGFVIFDLAHESIQSVPIMAGSTLVVLAIIEVIIAIWVRDRIRGRRLIEAILVSRFVVLAKASSMLGAIMLGAWLGMLGFLLPRLDIVEYVGHNVQSAVIGALCAAALIAAALWLEHCCRTPEQRDEDRTSDRQRP